MTDDVTSRQAQLRGGAAVGFLDELDPVGAEAVRVLRLWWSGGEDEALRVLERGSGDAGADAATRAVADLCGLCAAFGRRPLARHQPACRCVGADECALAHLVSAATGGEREDAMLLACLLVRPDAAPMLAAVAQDLGLALLRLGLAQAGHGRAGPFERLH